MEEEQFQLLRRFQYSSEALIYQGKLESMGVEVFLRDNHMVDTNPLYSNAVGGVKLYVKTKDIEKANEILKEISPYSIDDNHQPIQCPNCGSEQIDMMTSIKGWKSFLYFIILFFLFLFPFKARHKYKCEVCKHEFN
jgi:DNA-directed RNA polymerase subunit RPC12/RpoP